MSFVRMSIMCVLFLLAGVVVPGALELGDAAPRIHPAAWVKQGPVDLLDFHARAGQNFHLIDFWATWCMPCRQLAPHLTELQRMYKDRGLVVIAFSRETEEEVRRFVAGPGAGMGYAVAVDDDSRTYDAYMAAVRAPGFPYAFIVDRAGKVIWHGVPSPSEVDPVIAKVAADVYDPAGEALAKKAARLIPKYFSLARSGNDPEKASALGHKIVDDGAADPAMLREFASRILGELPRERRDGALAVAAAKKADAVLGGKDFVFAETLALALSENGEAGAAVDAQKRAVELCPNEILKGQLAKKLKEYEAACGGTE